MQGKRCGPREFQLDMELLTQSTTDHLPAMRKDFAWFLTRLPLGDSILHLSDSRNEQRVPAWSGFNATLRKTEVPNPSVVGYCQVIDSSPTELSTVYTVLKRSVAMADQLQQEDVIIVFDQAIYAKGLEILWKHTNEFQRVVLRMGAFHVSCVFLAVIGKRFGDAGLRDLMIESGIVGTGSVNGVLEGKQYNRAIRTHKVITEAMLRLHWGSFIQWLEDNSVQVLNTQEVTNAVKEVQEELSAHNVQKLLNLPGFNMLHDRYEEFCQSNQGIMAEFWQSYINMITLLLRFVRATWEGDWIRHLACVRDMLPWLFAYDRTNYARYLPVY